MNNYKAGMPAYLLEMVIKPKAMASQQIQPGASGIKHVLGAHGPHQVNDNNVDSSLPIHESIEAHIPEELDPQATNPHSRVLDSAQ